jgi:hypothetical protein
MKWKRFLLIGFAAAVLALTLYAVSLARAGTRTMQTTETDLAEQNQILPCGRCPKLHSVAPTMGIE